MKESPGHGIQQAAEISAGVMALNISTLHSKDNPLQSAIGAVAAALLFQSAIHGPRDLANQLQEQEKDTQKRLRPIIDAYHDFPIGYDDEALIRLEPTRQAFTDGFNTVLDAVSPFMPASVCLNTDRNLNAIYYLPARKELLKVYSMDFGVTNPRSNHTGLFPENFGPLDLDYLRTTERATFQSVDDFFQEPRRFRSGNDYYIDETIIALPLEQLEKKHNFLNILLNYPDADPRVYENGTFMNAAIEVDQAISRFSSEVEVIEAQKALDIQAGAARLTDAIEQVYGSDHWPESLYFMPVLSYFYYPREKKLIQADRQYGTACDAPLPDEETIREPSNTEWIQHGEFLRTLIMDSLVPDDDSAFIETHAPTNRHL